jgi:AraC-like DNA-binding protein
MPQHHQATVLATPFAGAYATVVSSARHFAKHWHGTYGFGLLDDGAQRSASGQGSVEAFAGQIITTNPSEVHDGRPLGAASRRWRMLYLEPETFQTVLAGPDTRPGNLHLKRPVIDDPRLRRALQVLFERLQGSQSPCLGAADVLACDEALAWACGELVARHADQKPVASAKPKMSVARDCLIDQLADPPSLATLASMLNLSRYQLVRHFNQAFGMTPYAWLQQQRGERARGLIRQGMSLAQAAAASGYADQAHLTRSFTRQFGFTPGAWRLTHHPGSRGRNQVQD